MAVIFAHGAGEVWCVVLGAGSLVIGLATYGYNVTRAMGTMMANLSPSRGFAAELATALVVLVASQLALPTSSNQCITGGIVGVGLMEGALKGVNWKHFAKQFLSWVATLFVVGLGVAALFAQGVYSPSKIDGNQAILYEDRVSNLSSNMYKNFNSTLQDYEGAAQAGVLTQLPASKWAELNETVNTQAGIIKNLTAKAASSVVTPENNMNHLYRALDLYQQYSIFTLGQNKVFPGANVCNSGDAAEIAANSMIECPAPQFVPSWVELLPPYPEPVQGSP